MYKTNHPRCRKKQLQRSEINEDCKTYKITMFHGKRNS